MNASKEIKRFCGIENIWQRSFYDRVIRDERDYAEALKYIDTNPYGK